MKKSIISVIFLVQIFLTIASANPAGTPAATAACNASIGGPTSAIRVFTSVLTTVYNMLPLKIAGVTVTPSFGLEDLTGV